MVTDITLDKIDATVQVGATTTHFKYFLLRLMQPIRILHGDHQVQAIATVADGVVTGVSLGTTTITAISQSDTTLKATCAVLVTPFNRAGYYCFRGYYI